MTFNWYWDAERLSVLVEVMDGFVFYDCEGCYLLPLDLPATVQYAFAQREVQITKSLAAHGLVILTQLGILAEPCDCPELLRARCRRRYHPTLAPLLLLDARIDALNIRFSLADVHH